MTLVKFGFAACLFVGLSACQLPVLEGLPSAHFAVRSVELVQSEIVVAAPRKYCIDETSVRDHASGGFVMLSRCDALQGKRAAASSRETAVLTLVSSAVSSAHLADSAQVSPDALVKFFKSEAGRTALSGEGDAAHVELIDVHSDDSVVFIHAKDVGSKPIKGLDDEYWRAVFVLNGRFLTLTSTGLASDTAAPSLLLQVLAEFSEKVIAENRQNPIGTVAEMEPKTGFLASLLR